jgi:hypothetical protein
MTNHLLARQAEYGESREALEKSWQKWLHHDPFNAPVASRLADIYREHMQRLDPTSDASALQQLERKRRRTEDRAGRYRMVLDPL